MGKYQSDAGKDQILHALDQHIRDRKDRQVMGLYLTDYPGSLERLAEECEISVSTVKRIVSRCSYVYKYLPGDELKLS